MGRDSNRFQEGNNRDGSRFSILINEVGLEDDPNSSHGISSNSVEDHVPNLPYINQTRIHKDTSKAKKSSGGNKQRLNTSISKLNTSKTHVSNDPNDSYALTSPKDHTTSMPMQTPLPSHLTKQPHAKPS